MTSSTASRSGIGFIHWLNKLILISITLSGFGCASDSSWLSSSGPSRKEVEEVRIEKVTSSVEGIQVVQVNDAIARRLLSRGHPRLFSDSLASAEVTSFLVGAGDVVEISIWEAPPAMLFGNAGTDLRQGPTTSRSTSLPDQMVSSDGAINMPFVGQVSAAGRTTHQIETELVRRLQGKANQVQVLVRVIRNVSSNVTVVGEVTTSTRMPLTARGERLLDALAAAGGVRPPVNKMTLQITRGNNVYSLPLDLIIRDPRQNIILQAGDVITAMHQPLSFTVLGATGKNEELNFETQGISLSQALARAGGLQDARADAQGVFIFRLEDVNALDWPATAISTSTGKVPVIYQFDLKDPSSFFVAQNFQISNKDILYVSNASASELQKFLNIIISVVYPVLNIINLTN